MRAGPLRGKRYRMEIVTNLDHISQRTTALPKKRSNPVNENLRNLSGY
jgi:hypothetical protein